MGDSNRGESPSASKLAKSHVASKSSISTHVLDTSRGVPASGITARLYKMHNDAWDLIKESNTDTNGRCADLADALNFEPGRYKIRLGVGEYFSRLNVESMFPIIEVIFDVKNADEHYHIPLLLNPFGFTTYRGS